MIPRLLLILLAAPLIFGRPLFAEEAAQPLKIPIIVHMMVYDRQKNLDVKIDGEYTVFDEEGMIISVGPRLGATRLVARMNEFFFGNRMIGTQKIMIKASGGAHIYLNGDPYAENVECVINGRGSFFVVNNVGIERYLEGVVAGEASPDTPSEALKAQAVISRTFAVFTVLRKQYDIFHMKKKTPQNYRPALSGESVFNKAVKETEGIILVYKGCVVPTYFSAVCGGETEFSENVWGPDFELPETIKCPYCGDSPNFSWNGEVALSELRNALLKDGMRIGHIRDIYPKKVSSVSNRITELVVEHSGGKSSVRTNRLRELLGPNRIKSTSFSIELGGGRIKFSGRGWGHGVGLCQYGAFKMASQGASYQDILKFYYPGMELRKIE